MTDDRGQGSGSRLALRPVPGSRVLLVDDDAIALRVVARLLKNQGYEVDTAGGGQEALMRMAETAYPLVVTDWMMPDIDGIELARRIRASEGLSYTYVVMLTSRGDDQADVNHALGAGVDDLLAKPVEREDLIARLRVAERIIALQRQLLQQNAELTTANQRMRRDLSAAAQVQRSLLPHAAPKARGWNAAWRSEACDELGGDTLNIFQLDEHHLAGFVLDVSGHGVGSSLLAVQASRLLQPVMGLGSMLKAPSREPPFYQLVPAKDLMRNLARKFPPNWDAPQFFTIVYVTIDTRSGRMVFASGGHCSPLIAAPARGARAIDLPSSAIGMLPVEDCEFVDATVTLEPGERVLVYSDGVTETQGDGEEVYGQERLLAIWGRNADRSLDQALDAILADLAAFRGRRPVVDDVTLLAWERS